MSTFILMHFMYHDREGILPVNTFATETAPGPEFANEVNFHVGNILQKFFVEPLPAAFFWIEAIESFQPEEEEGYGYVYAEQRKNDSLPISYNPYDAAVSIVDYILAYAIQQEELVDTDVYTFTDYTFSDIPASPAVAVNETIPTDPRFVKGETVVDRYGRKFNYRGVTHSPLNPKVGETHAEADYRNKNVKIGIKNKDYVAEKAILNFLATNDIPVHPLPSIAKRHLAKGTKWFALSSDGKKEGYGKTQKEAKEQLAFASLV